MVRQSERSESTRAALEAAARKLFASRGFSATSIDDLAARAGVAKGAFYHHFASKQEIFTRVLDSVQAEIAALPVPPAARRLREPLDQIADAVRRYLLAASEPGVRRILLVDGPEVIGWLKWREIDTKYFGAGTRAAIAGILGAAPGDRQVEVLSHLVLGAVMEGALICATAEDPRRSAREIASSLRRLLEGLRVSL